MSAPVGSFSGSLDPFQAKTITFLNGGFGAEYGNVLLGVVDVNTRGAPASASATINLGHGAGLRATDVFRRDLLFPLISSYENHNRILSILDTIRVVSAGC